MSIHGDSDDVDGDSDGVDGDSDVNDCVGVVMLMIVLVW